MQLMKRTNRNKKGGWEKKNRNMEENGYSKRRNRNKKKSKNKEPMTEKRSVPVKIFLPLKTIIMEELVPLKDHEFFQGQQKSGMSHSTLTYPRNLYSTLKSIRFTMLLEAKGNAIQSLETMFLVLLSIFSFI